MSTPEPATRTQAGLRFERWMRVVRAGDFARAYRRGGRARGAHLTVVAARNGLGWTRLGLSIGRRFHRRAVVRNRMRRLVREAFRHEFRALPVGFDLIAIGSEPAAKPELRELRAELVALARRAAARAKPAEAPRAAEPAP